MENFNENVVENDNINEEFEAEPVKEPEFNTYEENDGEGHSAGLIVKTIAIVGAAALLAYKGGKFVYKKAKDKAKAKLIEELKAEGWVNPNEESESDADEGDSENEE